MLIVFVIIGVVASLAVPSLVKAKQATENESAEGKSVGTAAPGSIVVKN